MGQFLVCIPLRDTRISPQIDFLLRPGDHNLIPSLGVEDDEYNLFRESGGGIHEPKASYVQAFGQVEQR